MEKTFEPKTSINKEELMARDKAFNHSVLHLSETSSLRITDEMRNAIKTFYNGDSIRINCERSSDEHNSCVSFAIEREAYGKEYDWQPGLIVTITNGWSPLSSHFSKMVVSAQRKAGNFDVVQSFTAKNDEVYIERQKISSVYGNFVEESVKKSYGFELLQILCEALDKMQGNIIHELESKMTISEHTRKENEVIILQYLKELVNDVNRKQSKAASR